MDELDDKINCGMVWVALHRPCPRCGQTSTGHPQTEAQVRTMQSDRKAAALDEIAKIKTWVIKAGTTVPGSLEQRAALDRLQAIIRSMP